VQVRSLYGRLISTYDAFGEPLGLALTGRYAAVLTRAAHTGAKAIIAADARTGGLLRVVSVQRNAAGPISASGGRLVYSAGRSIRLVDLASGRAQLLSFTRGAVVGVTISGRSVSWAENVGKRGRIRTLLLPR
jgi:hypothetical protein